MGSEALSREGRHALLWVGCSEEWSPLLSSRRQRQCPPSPNKRVIPGFEGGKPECVVKVHTMEHLVGCAGSVVLRNAVPATALSISGNRFSAAVDRWQSWPAKFQVALRCCNLLLAGFFWLHSILQHCTQSLSIGLLGFVHCFG